MHFFNKKIRSKAFYNASQKHESTLLNTYVLTEFLTAGPTVRLQQNIFEKNLLLAPFASKLVNYSRHSESLKNVWKWPNRSFWKKMSSILSSYESLKSHCASNRWPIWTQRVPKEAQICELPTCIRVFSKIFVVHERSAVKNSVSTYVWIKVDSCFCGSLYF